MSIIESPEQNSTEVRTAMNLVHELDLCRERATAYLASYSFETDSESYWLHSPTHDPVSRPGHLLYGTWAGTLASVLLGVDAVFDSAKRSRITNALNRFQRPDGTFEMPGVAAAERQGHDDEYFRFHCTNYALGALRALGQQARRQLTFMEAFSSEQQLGDWLKRRNPTRPWTEGNNIVNLASFYAVLAEDGQGWARRRLVELADWHDANQNPQTGFWHSGSGENVRLLLPAMAGAAHNLHIYYYLNREVPHAERIMDSCLRLGYMGIRSACVDIDVVDILVNLRRHNHRRDEIDFVLQRYLVELLQIQNEDGGYSDAYVTPEKLYGLVTPAHVSVTWATWFRLTTIGMIACALFPAERSRWSFRTTPGSGYFNLRHALAEDETGKENARELSRRAKVWLSTRRKTRFLRHHLTWVVRQRLRGAS